jgi:hypothetical protein
MPCGGGRPAMWRPSRGVWPGLARYLGTLKLATFLLHRSIICTLFLLTDDRPTWPQFRLFFATHGLKKETWLTVDFPNLRGDNMPHLFRQANHGTKSPIKSQVRAMQCRVTYPLHPGEAVDSPVSFASATRPYAGKPSMLVCTYIGCHGDISGSPVTLSLLDLLIWE